jgi:hypothetical protein
MSVCVLSTPVVGPPTTGWTEPTDKNACRLNLSSFSLMLPDLKEGKARLAPPGNHMDYDGTTQLALGGVLCWERTHFFPQIRSRGPATKPIFSLLKLNTFCKCWGLDTTLSRRLRARRTSECTGTRAGTLPTPLPFWCWVSELAESGRWVSLCAWSGLVWRPLRFSNGVVPCQVWCTVQQRPAPTHQQRDSGHLPPRALALLLKMVCPSVSLVLVPVPVIHTNRTKGGSLGWCAPSASL